MTKIMHFKLITHKCEQKYSLGCLENILVEREAFLNEQCEVPDNTHTFITLLLFNIAMIINTILVKIKIGVNPHIARIYFGSLTLL